jgi:RNA polymerase primary sigma factor
VARTVEPAEVPPPQAKKLLRSLAAAGVTMGVDDSASTRRRVGKDGMMAAESVTIHACPSVADPPRFYGARVAPKQPATQHGRAVRETGRTRPCSLIAPEGRS